MTSRDLEDSDASKADPLSFLTSAIVLVAAIVAIELSYRSSPIDPSLRKGANVLAAKQLDYATLGGDIVTTGNSRMYHAIKPSVIQDTLLRVKGQTYTTYNFGIPSGSSPMFLMIAHQAARHKPPPRVFVIGVGAVLSSCCDELALVGAPMGMSMPVIPLFLKAAWHTNPEDAGMAVFFGASRLLSGRTELLAAVHGLKMAPELRFQDRGYVSMGARVDAATQDVRAQGRARSYAGGMEKATGGAIHPLVHRELSEAIRVLQGAGVTVLLMGSPQARQLDWYHDAKHTYFEYLDEMKKLVDTFGVTFVDMNNPPVISNSDFVDGDHLSDPGATLFSRYIAEEVLARHLP
jgi:hypothetical protein